MSELTATAAGSTRSPARGAAPRPQRSWLRPAVLVVLLLVCLALPLYVEEFWLRTGFAVFAAGYQDQLLFLGRGFGDVVPYIVMIAVLLVRPAGLFGTKELTRV